MLRNFSRYALPTLFLLLLQPEVTGKKTVFVIGDSTAAKYDASTHPRTGWAQVFQPFFNTDSVLVNDQAASGRSSKSFYNEGRWTTVYNQLKPGDYVFIQFAHNDEKTEDTARYTNPSTTFKDYLNIYVNKSREKGAIPVLVSSIPRNNWSGSGIQRAHGPYTESMKALAAVQKAPFVDMEADAMAYLNLKGKTYAKDSVFNNLPAGVYPAYPTGNSDGTHLQLRGAYELCKVLVGGMKKVPELSALSALTVPAARLSAMPSPSLKGTVTGSGVYNAGTKVSLRATPASGYRFLKWTRQTDTVTISTATSITYSLDSTDVSLLAHFELISSVEMVSEGQVGLAPNPASNGFGIQTDATDFSVDVFDLTGRIRVSQMNQTWTDVSGLPAGQYLVRVTEPSHVWKSLLMVVR